MLDYRRPRHDVAANDPNRDTTCPFCEAPAKTEIVDDTFQHGDLKITVTLPVRQCADCDEEFLDHVGSRIKDEAVYHAHGLLSPWDIREIRERRGLSRPAFAEVTGLGEASIKRWETGATAQNRGNDRYLRLLNEDVCWSALKRIVSTDHGVTSSRVISGPWRRLEKSAEEKLQHEQEAFSLHSNAA